jgi:phosphate transport system permease protein
MRNKTVNIVLFISALSTLLVLAGMLYSLIIGSLPAFKYFGFFDFIFSSDWNPREDYEQYGALSFLNGTILIGLLALLISLPFSLSLTLLCGEYYKESTIAKGVCKTMNVLANFPSIILGVWGYFSLRPILIDLGIDNQGFGIFTASLVLAIMIIPYTSSLCIAFISKIPQNVKEAAYGLGATPIEVVSKISLPLIKKEVLAAYLLALVKVFGETMIVTILMQATLTSILFNQIGSVGDLKISSLIALALLLFMLTAIINWIAKQMLRRASV